MQYFTVDYSDNAYPRIRKAHDHDDEFMTFTQAKVALLRTCRSRRNHWADIIYATKKLKKENVTN